MQRLRHRPTHFFYRGDRMAFHRLQDGATLARLDPYADGEQVWLLHSGRDIAVTADEVRDISKQVHGLDLPATRPDGGSCNCGARFAAIEARLDALEASQRHEPEPFEVPAPDPRDAEIEALRARVAELEQPLSQVLDEKIEEHPELFGGDVEAVLGPLEALKAKIDAVRAGTQELSPQELIDMHRDDPPGAATKLEDAIRALKGEARRKLSELLNVELAELKNLRGMAGEDREREQQIEYLLGLFTRLGEI